MVEVYISFVSKSGSDTNVRVPIGVIASSSPATVKVTSSPSASVAVTSSNSCLVFSCAESSF